MKAEFVQIPGKFRPFTLRFETAQEAAVLWVALGNANEEDRKDAQTNGYYSKATKKALEDLGTAGINPIVTRITSELRKVNGGNANEG